MRTISESSDIEAIHIDDTYAVFEHDDFLVLSEEQDGDVAQEIKLIVCSSGLKDETIRQNLIHKLIVCGLDYLDEFEEDIAPKIFKKLKSDLQSLVSEEDKSRQKLNANLNEWKLMKSVFDSSLRFNLKTFSALEEFHNGKWTISDQLNDAKKLLLEHDEQFTAQIYSLLFYLIKRRQNLDSFMKEFSNVFRHFNSTSPSLRMFAYYLLKSSDFELRHRLTNLLSTSNPVPMLNMTIDEESNEFNCELSTELYWLLDNQTPTLLSFGVGNCRGKSRFINDLMLTNYELHRDSLFFEGTVDIQFDKNFTTSTKRRVHVADAHGQLSMQVIQRIGPMFDGFLLHVNESQKNCSSLLRLLRLLTSFTNCQSVYLIIRDAKNDIQALKNPIEEHWTPRGHNHLKVGNNIHICSFPNLSDPSMYPFDYMAIFREYFYAKAQSIQVNQRPVTIQEEYKDMLEASQKHSIEEISSSIKNLLNLIENTNGQEHLFALYPIFCEYSRTKVELNKIQIFTFDEKARFQLGKKCYKYMTALENCSGEERCEAVVKFQEIILSKYKLIAVPIFVQYLSSMLQSKVHRRSLSYDTFWREITQLFVKNPQSTVNQNTQESFSEFVLSGDPFEILDGDNMFFNFQFLSHVFQSLPVRIKVVSVIGQQNSGKSTLLNYMFGCDFCVSDGRTTKGIYGSLIRSNIPEYDYYLILDTEGLQSKERDDQEYDRKITLFCFAVSNVVIVNVKDQITADISRMLEFCADSLKQIHMTTVPKPEVYFVLNQQADPNTDNHVIAMRKIITEFRENNLNTLLDFTEAYFKTLPSAFNTTTVKVDNQRVFRCLTTSQEFMERVNIIANEILACNNDRRKNQPFKDMRTWLEFAYILFSTINKFPNLTYFKDVNERQQNDRIREWTRIKMEKEFSSLFKNSLLNIIRDTGYDDPSTILNQHFYSIQERLNIELDELCQVCGTSTEVRSRNSQFLEVQMSHTKNAWLREFLIDKQKECIKTTVLNGKGKIDLKIREIIQRNQIITTELATGEFDQLFEKILSEIKKEIDENNLNTNACAYIYSLYAIYERELFNIKCFEDFVSKKEDDVMSQLGDIKAHVFFSVKQAVSMMGGDESKLMSEELGKFVYLRQENISELYLDSCVNIEKAMEKLEKISKKSLINGCLVDLGLCVENDVLSNEAIKLSAITVDHLRIRFIPKLTSELKDRKVNALQSIKNVFAKFSDRSVNLTSDERVLSSMNEASNTQLFCQYIKHRFTRANRTLDDVNDLFDYKLFSRRVLNCVEKRLKSTVSGSRPVELEIVQGVISDINHEIKSCDAELAVFSLRLSIEAKNFAHQIAFKKLYEFYITHLRNNVEMNLLNLVNEKEKLYKFFIAQVVPDSQKDTENAELISNSFIQAVKTNAVELSKNVIRQTMDEHAPTLSRLQIQRNCDIVVSCTRDLDWVFDYVVNPTKVIVGDFEKQWANIQANLSVKINKIKLNSLSLFDELTDQLRNLLELINKLNSDRDYFIVNHLFEVNESQRVNNAYSNLHYQGVATAKFVFDYLIHNFSESYKFDEIEIKINLKEADIKYKVFNSDKSLIQLIKSLDRDFEKCSIGNLRFFIINLIEQIACEKEKFENLELDFGCLDEDDKLYDFYLDRVKSCMMQCPCCGKPCDAEHFRVQEVAGSENNKHSCSRGHQFRGMNGFKVHGTNEPSFKICEEMDENDLIMTGNKKMKWIAYRKLHCDWDFDTPFDVDFNTWKGKACNIWSQIGDRLCSHFNMEYVEFNCRQDEVIKPIHFILGLDSSTSMRGVKWKALMSSLAEFLSIRSEEGNEEDMVTILSFGSEAFECVSKAKIDKNLVDRVDYVGFYATYFSILLQQMINTMYESASDTHQFGLVIMSDGKPTFIENANDIMEKTNAMKDVFNSKIHKFWSIGFGSEKNDFGILKSIAETFNDKGKFLHSDSAGGLLQVYTEIARDMRKA